MRGVSGSATVWGCARVAEPWLSLLGDARRFRFGNRMGMRAGCGSPIGPGRRFEPFPCSACVSPPSLRRRFLILSIFVLWDTFQLIRLNWWRLDSVGCEVKYGGVYLFLVFWFGFGSFSVHFRPLSWRHISSSLPIGEKECGIRQWHVLVRRPVPTESNQFPHISAYKNNNNSNSNKKMDPIIYFQ